MRIDLFSPLPGRLVANPASHEEKRVDRRVDRRVWLGIRSRVKIGVRIIRVRVRVRLAKESFIPTRYAGQNGTWTSSTKRRVRVQFFVTQTNNNGFV